MSQPQGSRADAVSPWNGVLRGVWAFVWLALTVLILQKACAPSVLEGKREEILDRLQQERGSRVIAMIHRQEAVTLLGVPIAHHIDIEDSEVVLRAIRRTPPDQPIDFILHTPGGLVLAAEQIAHALLAHPGKVTVLVPHYAMSGGTLLALAADEVVMDPNAVLGPVDPQIGGMPAASILKVVETKPVEKIDDQTIILADVAAKARRQVTAFVTDLLLHHHSPDAAAKLAQALTEGRWTHDFPITVDAARGLGVLVSTDMPDMVYELMDLYSQSGAGRPSVLYVPLPRSVGEPESGSTPGPQR